MKGDFSRSTFRKEKHYSKVNMQEGRVQVDADWNEQVIIDQYRERTSILDIIGESGVPSNEKDGFRIKPKDNSYIISKGRYYVEGILCENEKDCDASEQPDLPSFGEYSPCPIKTGTYLAYLDVWERHLTYLDDPYIRETALGGTDTSTRSKIVWQVKVLRIGDIGQSGFDICSSARWLHLKERSSGSLQATVEKAGYSGLDNQLYRVEIHGAGNLGQATFKWSRNNGSIVSKIKSFTPIENKISVSVDSKDSLTKFAAGQWIEVIDDRQELWGVPGTMIRIQNIENNVITFDKDTFKGAAAANITYPKEFHPKIRRWESARGVTPITADHYVDLEDGIQVKFGPGHYRTGDYWTIPARTASREIEWPMNEEGSIPIPPEGIIHHYSPLALIELDQKQIKLVTDYRKVFDTTVSNTSKLCTDSGTTSIVLQPRRYKIIGPIQHRCNSVHRDLVPPLVIIGSESVVSNSNEPDHKTVLHMGDISTLALLSDHYGRVVADSKESEQMANALGLDGSLKPTSTFPPFFKPILIDSEKFFVLVANISEIELNLNLRWWAITANRFG
jgi:Family of unknown function (DUF6519)